MQVIKYTGSLVVKAVVVFRTCSVVIVLHSKELVIVLLCVATVTGCHLL